MITDERYRQIMNDVGMPNSRSLLQALKQFAHEVESPLRKELEEVKEKASKMCTGCCEQKIRKLCGCIGIK